MIRLRAYGVRQGGFPGLASGLSARRRGVIYPDVAGTITLTDPIQNQAFQRTIAVTISGTYTVSSGELVVVQARFNGGGWRVVDAAPAGGNFSGTLTLPAGVGTLEVRLNDSDVTDSATGVLVGEVFVIAGQSNAQGQGDNDQSYTGSLGSKMYRGGSWGDMADPVGENTSNGSAYPIFASELEAELGVPIGFIVGDTVGGTGLLSPDADWSDGGTQYETTVTDVNAAGTNGVRAIIWYQGEKDASTGRAKADYQTGLSQMLDDFQRDCAVLSGVPLVAALIGPSTGTDAHEDAIRQAIINRWESDSDIYPGPMAHAVYDPSDGLHWITDAEMTRLGKMWARSILGNFFSGESARGPVVASSVIGDGTTYTTSQIALTFTGVGSLTNGTDTTGWTVTDYNGARTISSMSASGNVLTITCDQELVGDVTVNFASGDNAEASTMVDGGSLVGLPPEPIYDLDAGEGVEVVPLKEDLLAWYEFETLLSDESVNARTLTNNNTVTQGTGKVGSSSASLVQASSQYLSRASYITTALGTGFSVAFWFKGNTSANQGLVNQAAGVTSNGQFVCYSNSSGRIFFRIINAGSGYIGRFANTSLLDGSWHLVVLRYTGSGTNAGCEIYLDNVQVDQFDSSSGTFTGINTTVTPFEIGKAASFYADAEFDNVAFWNKELTAQDRADLWNSGNGLAFADI